MLAIRQLEKVIDHRTALSIETLDVAAGEIVAIVGPIDNNASLLIRLICGELPVSHGSIVLDGHHIRQSADARSAISVLFTDDLLYERHSAQDNLELYCRLRDLPIERVAAVLALVGMSDQAQMRINKLSPSAQRRIAFARTLLSQPKLLLLEQPTIRADMETQALFARLITEAAQRDIAILLTDEYLAWSAKFCTRIVELDDGRITQCFAPNTPAAATVSTETSEPQPATPERFIPFKVPGRRDDRIMLYDPGEILYATSRDGKTILRTKSEEATTNLTLAELETRLLGRGFFKAHRAYLVNLQHIKSVIQYTRNSYTMQLNDAEETLIPLSKQSERELQDLLGY